MQRKVILDVDTGSDDAVAIMLAAGAKELDIVGITVTWGNRPVENCVENTLRVLELVHREDIPVYKGCSQPMVRYLTKQRNAALEKDGISIEIDGTEYSVHPPYLELPKSKGTAQQQHACSYLVETLKNSDEKITLVPVGPMTNIGMALRMEPAIKDKIEEIVLMGGAIGKGNITSCAEANFYHDPEAAKIMIDSGIPCRIVGLNATHSVELTLDDAKVLNRLGTPSAKFAGRLIETRIEALRKMGNGNGYSDAIHDALAVACVIDNSVIIKEERLRCDIDINGGAGDGQLIADYRLGYESDEQVMTWVVMEADKVKFFTMLCDGFSMK